MMTGYARSCPPSFSPPDNISSDTEHYPEPIRFQVRLLHGDIEPVTTPDLYTNVRVLLDMLSRQHEYDRNSLTAWLDQRQLQAEEMLKTLNLDLGSVIHLHLHTPQDTSQRLSPHTGLSFSTDDTDGHNLTLHSHDTDRLAAAGSAGSWLPSFPYRDGEPDVSTALIAEEERADDQVEWTNSAVLHMGIYCHICDTQ